jgi:transposase
MTAAAAVQVFVPRRYDVFVGLDVDRKSLAATALTHEGERRSWQMPCRSGSLLSYIHKKFPGQRVSFAYEAGGTGFRLYDELTAAGHTCLVAAPSMIPAPPGQQVKTNRLDSRKIAECLRGGQLTSIHIPSVQYRHLRHLVQLRDTFVRQSVATKNRIKALLLYEGIDFPGTSWSLAALQQLDALPCAGPVRFKLDRLLSSLRFSQEQALQTAREIHRFCQADAEITQCLAYLTTIPGIGMTTASHLLARIGDWRQLPGVRQLGSFLGLTPREHSTGGDVRRGPITAVGDERLRNKLVQAAWVAIRQDAGLKAFFDQIVRTHAAESAEKIAIVAVARKLTARIHAVLTQQRPYEIRPPKNVP